MTHQEYINIVDGADKAVLMVHGICSTPRHFDFLIPEIPEDVSVYNMLLEGHGKGVADFRKASMKKWKAQVKEALDMLTKTHSQVYIVGYSLGTLLTLAEAQNYPQIKGMLFFNSPLNIAPKPVIFWRCTKFCFNKVNKENPAELATFNDIGINLEPWLFKYILWIPRFSELLKLSPKCRAFAENASVTIYALFGEKDELVSIKSSIYFEKNQNAKIFKFKNSGHCYYEPEFLECTKKCFKEILSEN